MYTRFLQNPVPRLISFISYSIINKVFVSLVGFQENEGFTAGSTKSHGFKPCTINSSQIAVLDLFFHIVIKILFALHIRMAWWSYMHLGISCSRILAEQVVQPLAGNLGYNLCIQFILTH